MSLTSPITHNIENTTKYREYDLPLPGDRCVSEEDASVIRSIRLFHQQRNHSLTDSERLNPLADTLLHHITNKLAIHRLSLEDNSAISEAGSASAVRGTATAKPLYLCQEPYAQSGSKADEELSYRTKHHRRPVTWCPQSTPPEFSFNHLHDPPTTTDDHHNRQPAHSSVTHQATSKKSARSSKNSHSRPISEIGPYCSQRLQAQGLAEWLFFARLDRTNKSLSQLPTTMELKPSPQVNGNSDVNGNHTSEVSPQEPKVSAKFSVDKEQQQKQEDSQYGEGDALSPPPPPRPRTPIDERDPVQVYAERRYLSYFQAPPQGRRQLPKDPEVESDLTLQQIEAQKRYNNYFLGPPRASIPTENNDDKVVEPDEVQLAAQRRYESYFHPGPPRPTRTEEEKTPEPDAEQIEAERRYLSYFSAGPPRVRRPSSQTEHSPEPDTEQVEAEKRYMNYFKPGPPRPPPVEKQHTPEPDSEQLAAEQRYLAYFRPGPKRPRPTSNIERPSEPDADQIEAERRYLSYFNAGPPRRTRPHSAYENVFEPDEHQMEAERRYLSYFKGAPKARHGKEEEEEDKSTGKLRVPPTRAMLEAEERFLNYFKPIPCGAPKTLIDPPVDEKEKYRQMLMKEYWEAMETRLDRKEKKVVKVSRPKREYIREKTPPTQRELVVEEFLQRVKDRKKEKDIHFGDTDDEEEEEEKEKEKKAKVEIETKEDVTRRLDARLSGVSLTPSTEPTTPVIEGGGDVAKRIQEDLELFVSSEGE
ncbi:hypothetical protein SK128_012058 [Halocaridina rubra]|uniref:Uncharacterized protein n=1 Tax=Halocaridina rubra TaxID=373956 RepID=A0AAN8ZXY3_HALRR